MSKIESALAIDFARRGALVIPLVLTCMIVIPLWILTTLGREGGLSPGTAEGVTLHATLALMTGFVGAIAVIHALGNVRRFYVRPISAARLVGWQLLLAAGTIALLYVISAAILNVAGAGWPVLGPALFLATALACALAAIWCFEGSIIGQFLGCSATSIPLMFWLSRCYGARGLMDWQAKVMWQNPTAVEVLTLGGIGLVAYSCAVAGVARTRRGDLWDFSAIKAWWDRLCARGPAAQRFATPWAAQTWCAWREKLSLAPACILGGMSLFALIAWSTNWMPTEELHEFMVGMPLVLLMVLIPLLFGMVAGNCNKDGAGMKHVLATRPVTDSFLAGVILRTCALGLTWAYVTWLVGLGLIVWVVYLSGQSETFWNTLWTEKFNLEPVLTVVSVPLISWTATTCMATFFATGRPWLWVSVIFGLAGVAIVAYILRQLVTPEAFEILTILWLVVSGGLCAAGTVWAFISAAHLRMLTARTMVIAACLWLGLAIGLIGVTGVEMSHVFLLVQVVGLLSLAVLPLAAMPLAIRWNRHR